MPNNITPFKKYISLLDEVYARVAASAVLDGDSTLVRQGASAHELIIPKMEMDGLADHNRNGNITDGNVTLEFETVPIDYDRSRRFTIDAMDDEESAGIAFGKLSSEFMRTKVVPEVDAFRFARYAEKAGLVATGALADGNAVLAALVAASVAQDEAEVPTEDRHLFITSTALTAAQNADTTKSREILGNFAKIIKVPQRRFYTAINLLDGKSDGEEVGHFVKADGAANINFLSISKSAVLQYQKHIVSKIIRPELNQFGDGWILMYRECGLADVYANKTDGIYLHKSE